MADYMNPYNFVRLCPMAEGARQMPLGHKRLVNVHKDEQVYSGRLYGLITAFGPLMILSHDPADMVVGRGDHKRFARFFHYPEDERPVIPGSSLKGMVRAVAEAACNGCLSILNEKYVKRWEDFGDAYPPSLHFCGGLETNGAYCPTCRIFGTAPEEEAGTSERGAFPQAFRGKVRFGDAIFQDNLKGIYQEPVTLIALLDPKVSDRVWYSDSNRGSSQHPLAGRKFYYHHDALEPATTDRTTRFNATVTPLKPGGSFAFHLDFRNLLESELDLLLYALELEPAQTLVRVDGDSITFNWQEVKNQQGVYPKLGYGKPAGLGSVCVLVTEVVLFDPVMRYAGEGDKGQKRLVGQELRQFVEARKRQLQLSQTYAKGEKRYWQPYLSDLRNILRFPNGIRRFKYPSLAEFKRYQEESVKLPPPGHENQWRG
jgi:hypothetical protein